MKLFFVLFFLTLFAQNLEARYYDPKFGRFASPDPVMPDSSKPQALNPYAYNFNSPFKYIDPSGHVPVLAQGNDQDQLWHQDLKPLTQEPVRSGTSVLRRRDNGLQNEGQIAASSLSKFVEGYARVTSEPIFVDGYNPFTFEEAQKFSHYELQYFEYKKPDDSPVGQAWANLKMTLDLSKAVAQTLGQSPTTIAFSDSYQLTRDNPALIQRSGSRLGFKGSALDLKSLGASGFTYHLHFPLQDVVIPPDLVDKSRLKPGHDRLLVPQTADTTLYHEYVGHTGLKLYDNLVYEPTRVALNLLGIPTPNLRSDHNTPRQDRAGQYDRVDYIENVGRAAWDHLHSDKLGQVAHWHRQPPDKK